MFTAYRNFTFKYYVTPYQTLRDFVLFNKISHLQASFFVSNAIPNKWQLTCEKPTDLDEKELVSTLSLHPQSCSETQRCLPSPLSIHQKGPCLPAPGCLVRTAVNLL